MSKSSELDRTVKLYILDCIDNSGYSLSELSSNDKPGFVKQCFISEYGFNIERMGFIKALEEWLMGLPSSVSIAYTNHEILELAVKWDSIPHNYSEKQADKILNNYWSFMANKLSQLMNGYRIPKGE